MKKFRFYIDGNLIHPQYSMKQSRLYKAEKNQAFYIPELTEPFTILPPDYDIIKNADIEHEFTFICEELTDPSVPTWTNFFTGYFTRFDIKPLNEDRKIIKLKPRSSSAYRKLIEGLEKEFNIANLGIEKSVVKYKKYPVLQLYISDIRKGRMINFSGDQLWEDTYQNEYTESELLAEGFQLLNNTTPNLFGALGHASGSGLTNDVSGKYLFDVNFGFVRSPDSAFKMNQENSPGDPNWTLRDFNTNQIIYESTTYSIGEPIVLHAADASGDTIQFNIIKIYGRLLCNVESYGSVTTDDIGEDWVIESYNFKKYRTGFDIPDFVVEMTDLHQVSESIYGQIGGEAINNIGEYYFPTSVVSRFPIAKPYWNDISIWLHMSGTTRTLMNEVTETITLSDAYRLDRVIKALINQIDPVLIHQEYTSAFSDFLYSSINPLTGDDQNTLFVTAKTNIIVTNYDTAATVVPVKLKDLMKALYLMFGVKFHIWIQNIFKIEHGVYYDKGGSYTSDIVSIDLNTLVEPHSQKPWVTSTNEYDFEEPEIPGFIHPQWPDEVSAFFKGVAIELLSSYANKERRDEESIPLITTDLNFINANSNLVSKTGLVMLDAELISGEYHVSEDSASHPTYGATVTVQNGALSMTRLHEKFGRYQLPAKTAKINGNTVTALTVVKNVSQNLRLRVKTYIDPLKLIWTGIGKGKVERLRQFMRTGENQITVKHDTEI